LFEPNAVIGLVEQIRSTDIDAVDIMSILFNVKNLSIGPTSVAWAGVADLNCDAFPTQLLLDPRLRAYLVPAYNEADLTRGRKRFSTTLLRGEAMRRRHACHRAAEQMPHRLYTMAAFLLSI
jgi:hypothetical protein